MRNLAVFLILNWGAVSWGACANPRIITQVAEPFTWHGITLVNNSAYDQEVVVTVKALGAEKINNVVTTSAPYFGVCYYSSGTCTFIAPGGSSFTCTGNTDCTANLTIVKNGTVARIGYGSEVEITAGSATTGYLAKRSFDSSGASLITIKVCTNQGFLSGGLTNFDDFANVYSAIALNGGRPF